MWYVAHYEDDLDDYYTQDIWVEDDEDPVSVAYRECREAYTLFGVKPKVVDPHIKQVRTDNDDDDDE